MCVCVCLCVLQILKTLVVAILVAGVIPLLLGLLFELVIVAPLRVPLDQTPLFYPWQVCVCVCVCEFKTSLFSLSLSPCSGSSLSHAFMCLILSRCHPHSFWMSLPEMHCLTLMGSVTSRGDACGARQGYHVRLTATSWD